MELSQFITRFEQEHYIKGHSKSTIKTYVNNCLKFFEYIDVEPFSVTERDIKRYIYHCKKGGKQPVTCNQHISSLKSFYSIFCKNERFDPARNIEPMKMGVKVPTIISAQDIRKMIDCCGNLKHKAILIVIYSAGLRLAEVQRLKLRDIDSKRMVFKVTGKGNKQRLLPLHNDTLLFLRDYYRVYKPKMYLFEGTIVGRPLSDGTYQTMVKQVAQRAGIKSKVTPHTLRHCFATHMLDNGVSIKVIQEMLGHRSLQTTQIYTHVTREMKSKAFSPVTLLNLSGPSKEKEGENV